MNRYTVFHENPQRHYVKIMFEARVTDKITEICLPVWRPGRYELQNYAKNIKNFEVQDEAGNALTFKKVSKSVWHIYTIGAEFIRITYNYYAHALDAGASFFNHAQLYINPCNCMVYIAGRETDTCELHVKVPDGYQVAISLPFYEKNIYRAKDFHSLADSPFIASATLKKSSFEIGNSLVDLWFQGNFEYNEEKLLSDFEKYSRYQMNIFGDLPSKHYHYLFQMMPVKFHHGVEHMNNTVIAMGPDKNFDRTEFYNEFLGISSHEFFHLWNVKRIRPEEMWPYDYTKENYSTLGWIYEGVTTYYGDIALLRSDVFTFADWMPTFNKHLQKHFDNEGRYQYSVAESSYDTWLDGYTPGAPGRKVNIYTEGLLAAFILDIYIMKCTDNTRSLDDVMKEMYEYTWLKQKGYSEQTYRNIAEKICGRKLDWYFDNVIHGRGYIEKYLPEMLAYIGLELEEQATDLIKNSCGFVYTNKETNLVVNQVWPSSPADIAGIDEDLIITHINDTLASEYIWDHSINELKIKGTIQTEVVDFLIKTGEPIYYLDVKVKQLDLNNKNFVAWSKR